MAAFVRVSGPPNSNFLVGYPGISATLVKIYLFLLRVCLLTGYVLASHRRQGRDQTPNWGLRTGGDIFGPNMFTTARDDPSLCGVTGEEASWYTSARDNGHCGERAAVVQMSGREGI